MKIRELNITEFGCIKDKKIELSNGLNLICGDNEAGKSTVMLFIKYMLYGLPRRSASNFDRERSISFSGKTAAGSMIFESDGKRYAVERHFHGARGSDSFKLISLDSGETVDIDRQPGEYFLGVPREVFDSSAGIGQMRTAELNGEKTVGAIENILSSADESVDTAKVISNLDKIRTEYRHKNGSGGKLYRTEQQMAELREKLRTAKERDVMLKAHKLKLAEKEREVAEGEKEFGRLDRLYEEIQCVSVIRQFDRLHESEKELARIRAEKEAYKNKKENSHFNIEEGNKVIEELSRALSEYDAACRELADAEAALRDAEERKGDPRLAAEGEKFRYMGGKDKIIKDILQIEGQCKKRLGAGVVSLVLSVCDIGVFTVMAVIFGAVFKTWLSLIPLPVFAAMSAVFFCMRGKSKKKYRELLGKFKDIDELSEYVELCENNIKLCEESRVLVSKAEGRREAAERRAAEHSARLVGMLEGLGEKQSADLMTDAKSKISQINCAYSRWKELLLDEARLSEAVRTIKAPLTSYDEGSLRESISIDISQVNDELLADVVKKRKFYGVRLDAAKQSARNLSDSVLRLEANFIDPLEIADRLSALEAEQTEDREFFEALVLAMESIERASEKLQGNITPEIGRRAGDMMSIVSGGRYAEVNTGKKLNPSLTENGLPIAAELLSGGTRDAVYIILRISLMSQIFGVNTPPLLMDESLCQLDDKRTERILALLSELTKTDMQILLFTCHSREEEICNRLGIEPEIIEL